MSLAVCVLFDRSSDLLVHALWERLEAAGVPTLLSLTHQRHRPHLSYAVALRWDLPPLLAAVAALPHGGGFPLPVHGMLTFPRGRVALAPSVSAGVALRQEAVARAVDGAGALLHHHYEPGSWVPHVALATRAHRAQLPAVARIVNDTLPVTLHVEGAALIDSGTGELWPLAGIP